MSEVLPYVTCDFDRWIYDCLMRLCHRFIDLACLFETCAKKTTPTNRGLSKPRSRATSLSPYEPLIKNIIFMRL